MSTRATEVSTMYYLAWTSVVIGVLALIGIAVMVPTGPLLKGLGLICLACIAFGGGEVLNHPKEEIFIPESERKSELKQYRRRRNICAMGNLLVIIGLLSFFIGLSALLNSG